MYGRISLTKPREGQAAALTRAHEELLRTYRTMDGFIRGYLISATDQSGRIGRVTFCQSDVDADRAAQQGHVLAIRSEMPRFVDEESDIHIEQRFEAAEV